MLFHQFILARNFLIRQLFLLSYVVLYYLHWKITKFDGDSLRSKVYNVIMDFRQFFVCQSVVCVAERRWTTNWMKIFCVPSVDTCVYGLPIIHRLNGMMDVCVIDVLCEAHWMHSLPFICMKMTVLHRWRYFLHETTDFIQYFSYTWTNCFLVEESCPMQMELKGFWNEEKAYNLYARMHVARRTAKNISAQIRGENIQIRMIVDCEYFGFGFFFMITWLNSMFWKLIENIHYDEHRLNLLQLDACEYRVLPERSWCLLNAHREIITITNSCLSDITSISSKKTRCLCHFKKLLLFAH